VKDIITKKEVIRTLVIAAVMTILIITIAMILKHFGVL